MSTDTELSPARVAAAIPEANESQDSAPQTSDALSELTSAIIGGAPQEEVARLEDAYLASMKGADPNAQETGDGVSSLPISAASATDAPAGAIPSAADSPVHALTAQVADYERQIGELAANEGLFNAQVAQLVLEHGRAMAGLAEARSADREASMRQAAFASRRQAVLEDTMRDYPELTDRGSAMWKVAAQLAQEAHDPSHPHHWEARGVNAPRFFAERAAELLGAGPAGAVAVSRTPLPAMPYRPGPVSGARQTFPPSAARSAADRLAAAQARTLAMIGGQRSEDGDGETPVLVL